MSRISVVIPCYRVRNQILGVVRDIGAEVEHIYCVDDCCPQQSGKYISRHIRDKRVKVLYHARNSGVGGAVLTGYLAALQDGTDIIVKLDGDGQMDPKLISRIIRPIEEGHADYTKGNRFYFVDNLKSMPVIRKIGNAVLSLMCKFSSGYWNIFDPTNGFTAIHSSIAGELPMQRIARDYFFESDILFWLNHISAVVVDVPIEARYGDEQSNLNLPKAIVEFMWLHLKNFVKRIIYGYFIRNFTIGTIELMLAGILLPFGAVFGIINWCRSLITSETASAGTVMLSALPIILGMQMLISFFNQDINSVPRFPRHKLLIDKK